MGPADISDLSLNPNNQGLSLPKIKGDSSNWATYSERILNYMTSKGFCRHILGTTCKPEAIVDCDGKFFLGASKDAVTISGKALSKHEDSMDLYDQMQATVREIIYRTVDKTTFLQIKNEPDATSVWKKVVMIHADKGSLYEANLLVQLQNMRYNEKESMREHVGKMTEIRERLAEMNAAISDESFISYLQTSLSLAPSYRNLFTTLSTTSRQTGKKLSAADVIWHLTKEATSVKIEDSINKSNAAMMAALSNPKDGKGKGKEKKSKTPKSDAVCSNKICGKVSHTSDQCFEKGGGREGQALDWWKKMKAKKDKKSNANVAEAKSEDKPEDYAMLASESTSLDNRHSCVPQTSAPKLMRPLVNPESSSIAELAVIFRQIARSS